MENENESQITEVSPESTDSRRGHSRTFYVAVLGGLVAVIIGLTIGIIIVNPFAGEPEPEPEAGVEQAGEIVSEITYEIDNGLTEALGMSPSLTTEDIQNGVKYLEDLKSSGMINGQVVPDNVDFYIDNSIVNLLLQNNQADEALEYLETMQKENFGKRNLLVVYNQYQKAYRLLGDTEKSKEYFDKYVEIRNQISQEEE